MEEKIKNLIEEFMEKASIDVECVEVSLDGEGHELWCRISSGEPHFLIGRSGENLAALSHIIRKIISNKIIKDRESNINIIVDVNDYQKKKIENLKTMAHMMAERARFFKSNIEIKPMSAYDRRIIHEYLTDVSDVKTESTGEGRDRRIVIKYISS